MDGVSRVAGVGPTIELGGRSWIVRGRTVEYYALLEAEIIKLRGNPFDLIVTAARQMKDDPAAVDLVARTVAERFRNWRFATYADHADFNNTPYGDAFKIWAAICDQDGALSVQKIVFWMMELYAQEGKAGLAKRDAILDAIDQASSDDALGNSTGRREMSQAPAA